jgi:uncharacterized protein
MRRAIPLLLLLAAGPSFAQEPGPRITVTGEARVEAPPDLATFTAGVQSEAPEAAEALAATSTTMQAVFDALAAAGVEPRDMQTSQFGVDPLWAEGEEDPRVRGYSASNLVTVRVRDVARLGAMIDAVGAAGANRIFAVGFDIAEPRARLDEARAQAVADARARAEILAQAAGVALGSIVSIREAEGAEPGPMFARTEMDAAQPIAEGVVGLTARVEIVFAIQ